MKAGPSSDAILVAIVLALVAEVRAREAANPEFVYERTEPLLPDQLRAWRNEQWPPFAYAKMEEPINEPLEWAANRYGLEVPRYAWSALNRWVTKHYKIPPARWEPSR